MQPTETASAILAARVSICTRLPPAATVRRSLPAVWIACCGFGTIKARNWQSLPRRRNRPAHVRHRSSAKRCFLQGISSNRCRRNVHLAFHAWAAVRHVEFTSGARAALLSTRHCSAMSNPKSAVDPLAAPSSTASPPPKSSGARLIVLLGLLGLVIGAYAYDYGVARPAVDAAETKVNDFVDARNRLGVKEGGPVTPDDIHKELGIKPTFVEKHGADQNSQ